MITFAKNISGKRNMIKNRRIFTVLSLLFLAVGAGMGAASGDGLRQGIRVRMPVPTVITSEVVSPGSVVLGAMTTLENPARNRATVVMRNTLYDPFGKPVAKGEREITLRASVRGKAAQKVTVEKPMLWSPEDPALYTLITEVWQDNALLDRRQHTAGFAAIVLPQTGYVMVNGRHTPLKGVTVARHADDTALRRVLRLAAIAGANAIIPADTMMIDNLAAATDREGLLLIVPRLGRTFGAAHPSLVTADSALLCSVMANAIPSDSIIGADGFPVSSFDAIAARWDGDRSFAARYASPPARGETPVALRLQAEQPSMSVADFRPAYIVAELVDSDGKVCRGADLPVTFTVRGESPRTVVTTGGRAWIALSGAHQKGRLRIAATAPGVRGARTSIDIY